MLENGGVGGIMKGRGLGLLGGYDNFTAKTKISKSPMKARIKKKAAQWVGVARIQ